MRLREFFKYTTFIVAASLAETHAPLAQAQDAAPPTTTPPATKPVAVTQPPVSSKEAPTAETPADEVVVITGSRIKKATQFTAPSPVQVLTSEDADLRGLSDTARFLQGASIAAGSAQIDTKTSSAFVTTGGPGASTIDLRGLGANRTLVLLNGRRAGPAGVRGEVASFDLNVLPESAIDHVEILTDGASSIYGSDAISGVVNIITKNKGDGGDIEAFGSFPQDKTGGSEYRLSSSWGHDFSRGRFNVSFDYYHRNELKVKDARGGACAENYVFDPATGQRKDIIDPFTGKYKCANLPVGQIWAYDYDSDSTNSFNQSSPIFLQYDATGQLLAHSPHSAYPAAMDAGDLTAPPNWYVVGIPGDLSTEGVLNENSQYIQNSGLDPRVERFTAYMNGEFDINASTTAYAEVLLNRRKSSLTGYRQVWDFQYTNTYDPITNPGFTGPWILSPTGIVDWGNTSQTVDYSRSVLGVRGDFGHWLPSWKWDLNGQYSLSSGSYMTQQILDDAINSQSFRTESCVGTTLPLSGKPCEDFDFTSPDFLDGNWSQEMRDYFLATETGHTTYTETYFEGSANGNLFKLPAGMVTAAAGATFRHDTLHDTPGDITLAGNAWGNSESGITKGSDSTLEYYGELNIPLIKNWPAIKSLEFAGSVRQTHVNSAGDATTYKTGLNWQVSDGFRVRATKGTSFRAPALYELYLASQTGFVRLSSIDPCINWGTALIAGTITPTIANNCSNEGIPDNLSGSGVEAETVSSGALAGGTKLEPETADTSTIGFVVTPDRHLSFSADYFQIEVKNEVTRLGAAAILRGCYEAPDPMTEPLCALFTRDPLSDNVESVTDNFINIARQLNRGVDFNLRYTHQLGPGRLTIDNQYTFVLQNEQTLLPTERPKEYVGTVGYPDLVGDTTIRYDLNDWTFQWSMQYIGGTSDEKYCQTYQTCFGTEGNSASAFYPYVAVVGTKPVLYHDFSVRKQFKTWSVLFGVANIFDTDPPQVTNLGGEGNYDIIDGTNVLGVSQYDLIGRRFFFNISKKF